MPGFKILAGCVTDAISVSQRSKNDVCTAVTMTGGHKAWPMDGCTYSQIIATHGLSSAELLDMADRVSN